jgi:hypothetical protein
MTESGTKPPIHLSSPIYLFPVRIEREKTDKFFDYCSYEHAIEDGQGTVDGSFILRHPSLGWD